MPGAISQSEKDKYHMISLICSIKKTDKQISSKELKKRERERGGQTKKQTLTYREQTDDYQRGGWRGEWVK